jgi:hypothetical protein
VTSVCAEARSGGYPFFSHWTGDLGWPPNFNLDPVNQITWPVGEHWMDTARSGPPRNDIKLVWEPSRFSLAYYLARQYAYDRRDEWAVLFWEMFRAWCEQNPINQSVAWACGQEVAFRLMAMLTGAFTMLESPATTSGDLEALENLLWHFAIRIEANINYARSQENNHGLSEAAGLWTVGLLFPEFRESKGWIRLANQVFRSEIPRQIYDDGSYVQHSMTYHRVMLDVMLWVQALGLVNQHPLEPQILERLRAATRWLDQFVDRSTGRVPNYGANDGANILPLSCCGYLDFRPTLWAACSLLGVPTDVGPGIWSEKAFWLTGESKVMVNSEPRKDCWSAPTGGYFILRGSASQLMTRAVQYRDRPSQCDLLHVDLWMQGCNILRDAGTYHYYHQDQKLKDYFYSVEAHNTIQVGDQEQMQKGPHFLWFHWPKGIGRSRGPNRLECVAHISTDRPYSHYRTIQREGENYQIDDRVEGASEFQLRWRLAPELPWSQSASATFETQLPSGRRIVIRLEGKGAPRARLVVGHESLYYGECTSVPTIQVDGIPGPILTRIEWMA